MKKYMILLLFAVFTSNSYAQNSFNLGASGTSRFDVTDKVWPQEIGEADVCLWADDKLAAFSISIDDNIEYEVPFWKEMQAKYGFNFTWFVITEETILDGETDTNVANWDAYREAVALGNEVEGHGDRNWYKDPNESEGEANPDNDTYRAGIQAVKTKIETEIPDYKCLTYAYPYGVGNESVAKDEFIAIRGTFGALNNADKIDYTDVNSVSNNHIYTEAGRDNYLLPLTTKDAKLWNVNYYRGWASTHFHGLDNDGDKKTADAFLAYLSEKDLWVDGFTRVAQYSQSFATHSLNMGDVTEASIKFTLTDGMDNDAFYFPLTVKVRINNAWSKVTATQSGESVDAKIIIHEGSKYALVKAVPDVGEVTLTGEIGASTFTFGTIEDIKLEVDKTAKMKFSATSSNPDDEITFSIKDKPSFITMTSSEKEATYYKTKNNTKTKNYTATNSESTVDTLYAIPGDGYVSDPADFDGSKNNATKLPNPAIGNYMTLGTTVIGTYKEGEVDKNNKNMLGITTAIIPFQLPARPEGQLVSDASFKVYVASGRPGVVNFNVDLYGLPYRSDYPILVSDRYVGAFESTQNTGIKGIADDFIVFDPDSNNKDSNNNEYHKVGWNTISEDASEVLADYINEQYDNGAKAGDYVFMRLSIDNTVQTPYQYYTIDGGDGKSTSNTGGWDNSATNPAELSFSFKAASSTVSFAKEIGAKSMTENEELEVEFSATSSNSNAVTFSLQNAISFATITSDNGSGKITFAPKSGDAGEHTVVIAATNGDVTASSTFILTVVEDVAYRGEITIAPKKEHLGEHSITIVATNGTDTAEKTFKITVVAAGDGDGDGDLSITEFGMETFQMYPNPVSNNVLTISTESFGKTFSVNIYSLSGNILYAEQVRNAGKKHQINVNFKKGIYIVCINDGEKIISKKLSVE